MARMVHQIFASGKRPDSCGFQPDAKLVIFGSTLLNQVLWVRPLVTMILHLGNLARCNKVG